MEQNYYFDIHCHLIPGVDDGAKDIVESLAALKEEYDQNVRRIICTPHVTADITSQKAESIKAAFDELKNRLEKTDFGQDMELYLGCELMYSESLAERLEDGEIWTMSGSSYILVEFLPTVPYEELYRAVRKLSAKGYIPILAHIERYLCLYKRMERIRDLQESGAYFQVNASSLKGGMLNKKAAYIKKLCKSGLVHFLATDSHGMEYRQPDIKKGAEWVIHNCDSRVGQKILYQNGIAVLNDIII
ncbi:CpsB/CapC family capsule biosynthesis tyrosine phosphatase [Lacrimispora sp.]|uniref:CpsB/CapC family capsule biosynthesis tyrosine phosphatase n=1 Tax=Lacrimispora sp. TaxID=2719234 RepID=UPI002859478E|nr:CpsB/CapC family capsule biosynthesis tyrosine phosphatase [Lacrimispora sp.]MDR7813040.1 CpsB/CapC family capsule biosynthesis tyrosine phosphatase [Lacrimispora sp.]